MTGCPLIINGLGGVMPQERITTKFCAKHQFGPRLRKAVDLLPIIQSWLDDPEKYLEVRENVIRSRPEHDPVELLEKVAGMGTLTRNVA
jgi:processive 1,2-diacylglycerol beta-glucosyltransferase